MSIKELFQKIFGGIAKLFTAKNGVRNLFLLIIGFFIAFAVIGEFLLPYLDYRNDCREMIENAGWTEKKCEEFRELFSD